MKYFLSKTILLRRLRGVGGDVNRSVYSATGTADGYPASLQESSPDKVAMWGGQIGNLWECFVEEDCPAMEADQVVIEGQTYSVQNVRDEDFGNLAYKKLTIVRSGNNTDTI
jgi:hypothetical protein